jgi:hypothetical protein
MGCVLGPTMANYYMGHLENITLTDNVKPKTYTRFVDDIFVAIKDEEQLLNIRNKLEQNSCLKFTYELEKEGILNFLDVKVKREKDKYR